MESPTTGRKTGAMGESRDTSLTLLVIEGGVEKCGEFGGGRLRLVNLEGGRER